MYVYYTHYVHLLIISDLKIISAQSWII